MMKKLILILAVYFGVVDAMSKVKDMSVESSDSGSYQSVSSYSTSESEEWVENHRELVDSAKINGCSFDELIGTLSKDKKFYIYDYISSKCWNGSGKFGAFHDENGFFATFESQEYIE